MKKRPTKEEERFGVDSALDCCLCWDQWVLIWGQSGTPLLLLWLVSTKRQVSKIVSALFYPACVSDVKRENKNEVPSCPDSAYWAEQQNLTLLLTCCSNTEAWTSSVWWTFQHFDLTAVCGSTTIYLIVGYLRHDFNRAVYSLAQLTIFLHSTKYCTQYLHY